MTRLRQLRGQKSEMISATQIRPSSVEIQHISVNVIPTAGIKNNDIPAQLLSEAVAAAQVKQFRCSGIESYRWTPTASCHRCITRMRRGETAANSDKLQ